MTAESDLPKARLSADFRISVPKALRERRGWKPGQQFVFITTADNGVLLVPVPEREAMAGIASGADPTGYRDRNDRF